MKKIPEATWKALEEALVLTPSSYGLQPWKFLVIDDDDLRAKLRPHAGGQSQVTDCSHFVVLTMRKNIGAEEIDHYIRQVATVRKMPVESLVHYREKMIEGLVYSYRSLNVNTWASNQTFIALGQLLVSAALLKIDTCAMEGFDPRAFDEILGIGRHGLSAVVCCALGYRLESDKYSHLAKVRYEAGEVIEHF